MNSPLAPRFLLRITAVALVILAVGVGIGGMVAAQTPPPKGDGVIRQPPQPPVQVTCVPATPPVIVTPVFTPAPGCGSGSSALSADITIVGNTSQALFRNTSSQCSYRIGLASYRRVDNNIDNQQLYDWELAVIPPDSTLQLTVDNPPCAYQVDAFRGDLIVSFAGGVRYGSRLLDDHSGGGNYCPPACPTTPTPLPTCPPATPPVIVTPAWTPGPGCGSGSSALSADITIVGSTSQALFRNTSSQCSYRIGLASYRRVDNNIDHQILYDWELAVIPPDSTMQLTVDNPPCAYQVDAFRGDLIVSFAGGVRYGSRLLDDRSGGGAFCPPACPVTPTPLPTCPPATPPVVVTPAWTPGPGCAPTPGPTTLEATITDHALTTEARFTNHSNTCAYRIGLATYKKFDNNIDNQELYDWELAVIPPNSSLVLEVDNPPCAYQGDAFWGDLILSFAGGVRYGPRLLDDTDGVNHQFCTPLVCATPVPATPTRAVTGTPPTSTPVVKNTATATATQIVKNTATVTGTPPTATRTIPPTNTATATRTVTGTPPTATSTSTPTRTSTAGTTGTVTRTSTPTRTSTAGTTGTVTRTSTPQVTVTTTCCSALTATVDRDCFRIITPSPTPVMNKMFNLLGPPTATPIPQCLIEHIYQATITSTCTIPLTAMYFATLEYSDDLITWTPQATTTPAPLTIVPGPNMVNDAFPPQPVTIAVYYRVRVTVTLANNCGTFNFISVEDFTCDCTLNAGQPPPRRPTDH